MLVTRPVFASDLQLNCGEGHDTTASILSFAVALLATHQEEQEELYGHIRSVVPDGRLPVRRDSNHHAMLTLIYQMYQDVPRLTRVLAVIYEALRLFSPVCSSSQDTVSRSMTVRCP